MDRDSEEYGGKKREVEEFLWGTTNEYVPNTREIAVKSTVQVGTPLAHK